MKYKIITFGCAANKADTGIMKKLLSKDNEESEKPDLVIFNTCGVKGVTENKIISEIKRHKDKKIIIAGCLPKISKERLEKEFPDYSMIGPDQVLDIVKVAKEVMEGKKVIELSSKYCDRVIDTVHTQIEIVPISQGCLGNCHYCGTKNARGDLSSYPADKIVRKIENSKAKIVYLTSQDNGCYGLDTTTNIVKLLEKVVKIEREFTLRNGMMNPNHVIKYLDKLIEVYKNDKIMKFLHIPVQSGSNKVLKEMNRLYTVEEFKMIVKRFREEFPKITIATDIIVGYPTETEKDFEETLQLVRETNPNIINISKYYVRHNTEAANMKQLNSKILKSRSLELTKLYKSLRK